METELILKQPEPVSVEADFFRGKTKEKPAVVVGLFSDVHFADKEAWRSRVYRDSFKKLRKCIDHFNCLKPDFVVELGDLVDSAETKEVELENLLKIDREFRRFSGPRHYVFGNHCVHTLTKREFAEVTGASPSGFYSFDSNGFHFVILDACFRSDGVGYERGNFDWTDSDIPMEEREWLRKDLAETGLPTILFIHQRLDTEDRYGIRSATGIRSILKETVRVKAVFQGHSHENDYRKIDGIHYVTLRAMVEGAGEEENAYAVLEVFRNESMILHGFGKQMSRRLR